MQKKTPKTSYLNDTLYIISFVYYLHTRKVSLRYIKYWLRLYSKNQPPMGDQHNLQLGGPGCIRHEAEGDCVDHTGGVGSCFYPTIIFTEKLMYDGIPGISHKLLVGDPHHLPYPYLQAKKPLVMG